MRFVRSWHWTQRQWSKLKHLLRGFTLPVVVSIGSLVVASVSLWLTRQNTQIAQRAYLSHKFEVLNPGKLLEDVQKNNWSTTVNYRLIITNYGNTPALTINPSAYIRPTYAVVPANIFPLHPIGFDLAPKESMSVSAASTVQRKPNIDESQGKVGFGTVVAGKIGYWDVFGRYEEQIFCHNIQVGDLGVSSDDCTLDLKRQDAEVKTKETQK